LKTVYKNTWGCNPNVKTQKNVTVRFEMRLFAMFWWRKLSLSKRVSRYRVTDATSLFEVLLNSGSTSLCRPL